jgi:hypothetical protein
LSNLDAVLAAAKAQSTNLVPLTPQTPALTPNTGGGAVAAYNMNEDAFLNPGGMEVASYIQVKEGGIKLAKEWDGFVDEFEAIIDLSEVQFFMGIRKEVGSTVSYAKTYDGQSTPRGENFAVLVEQFKRDSQKPADVYRGADIPMTLVADVADPKKKGALEAGTVVGLTTSITGFKPWAAFQKKLANAGFGKAQIKVKVTHSVRKNAANQGYGVCEYSLVEILNQDSIAA